MSGRDKDPGYRLSAFGSLMFNTVNKKPTADCGQPRHTRRNAMHSLNIHTPSHIAEMLRLKREDQTATRRTPWARNRTRPDGMQGCAMGDVTAPADVPRAAGGG